LRRGTTEKNFFQNNKEVIKKANFKTVAPATVKKNYAVPALTAIL
jgi:hypothetical protein